MNDVIVQDVRPTQISAIVTGIFFSGALAIVAFEGDSYCQFRLLGDKSRVAPLFDYVGQEVFLSIHHQSEWSCVPASERVVA